MEFIRFRRCVVPLCCLGLLLTGCSQDPAAREARFLQRGKQYLDKKDFDRAILEFRNASQVQPKDAEPFYQLGVAYLAAHRTGQAVDALRRATELKPTHKQAQLRLSELMIQSRNSQVWSEAVNRLGQVLAADPGDPDVLDTLALADLKLKKPEDAEKLLQEALQRFPANLRTAATLASVQYMKQDPAAAEQTLKAAQAQAPKLADAYFALGHLYQLEHRNIQAEGQFEQALQIDPANARTLLSLAAVQLSEGSTTRAGETYRKLADLPGGNLSHIHAAFLYHIGKQEEALVELKSLADRHPKDGAARLRVAGAYIAVGRPGDAMQYLKSVLDQNPKDADARLLRSRIYLDRSDIAAAESDLVAVERLRPDSADVHYGLSKVFGLRGMEKSRQRELSETLRIRSDLLGARIELAKEQISLGQPSAALETIESAPAVQKSLPALVAVRNWALIASDRLDEAADSIEKGLAQRKDPELLLQRGVMSAMKKDYAKARADAEEVLRLSPDSSRALNLAVEASLDRKDRAAALRLLQDAAARNSRSAAMQTVIGEWLQRLGLLIEARHAFDAAKALNPSYTPADLDLAGLDAKEGKTDSALRILRDVISVAPRNEAAHLSLAMIEYSNRNTVDALAEFQKVVELDPDNVVALNAAAYLLALTETDTALKYAEHALELSPESANVEDTLGYIYFRKGMYQQATEFLSKAVATQPTAAHQFHLAMSYLKVGDHTQSAGVLAQALAKDPNVMNTEGEWRAGSPAGQANSAQDGANKFKY